MFSTFPSGYPGFGLLILRAALGITALFRGAQYLSETDGSMFLSQFTGLLAIAVGAFLLVGFMTTIISLIAFAGGIVILAVAANFNAPVLSEIYAIVFAAAIVFLGPGAFSLDARFFGRREIIIPKKSSASDN